MFFFLEYQYYSNETETCNRLGTLWGSVKYRLPNFRRDTVQQKELLSQILLQSARLHRVAQPLKPEDHAIQTKRLISVCRDTLSNTKARVPAFSQEEMKCGSVQCGENLRKTPVDLSKPYPDCCSNCEIIDHNLPASMIAVAR
uniref:Uncharacterized protein n=1 Tax=Trichogramma kaykai TaxID=54128 RepID=A0ABD2X366_9HYME